MTVHDQTNSFINSIQAVVFDLYGTLIHLHHDSKPYLKLARIAAPRHPQSVVDQALRTHTAGIVDFAERLKLPASSAWSQLDEKLQEDLQSAHLFDDVIATLVELRSCGIKLGLISNLASPYKQPCDTLGLIGHFDAVLFSCDVGLRKPDRALFLRMNTQLGVQPEACLMVGDSLRSDYDGAKSAGWNAILLRRNGDAPGAITSLKELTAMFETRRDQ